MSERRDEGSPNHAACDGRGLPGARIRYVSDELKQLLGRRVDVCTLEADMAFFDARLSLAADAPDTVYQRAQIKTYQALGAQLGETLRTLRPGATSASRKGSTAAA